MLSTKLFLSYFGNIKYLDGGVDTGFNHVEASKEEPHLYRVKGTGKAMSMTQVPLSKSSLNQGDAFILFANKSMVWIWHGQSSNLEEKAQSIAAAEEMCTEGTVSVIESYESEGDNPEFWAYLGDGSIQPALDGDDEVDDFTPVLYRIKNKGSDEDINAEKIAEAEPIKKRWGSPTSRIARSLLNDDDVFLLDAGFQVFLWMGKVCDKRDRKSVV